MKQLFAVTAMLLATAAFAADRSFSAADAPGIGIKHPGRIVIRNDERSITAYHFLGSVREALLSLKSARIRYTSFGSAVYDSNATLGTPMPAYLSALITEAGKTHGVDPRLIAAVAHRESAFNPRAVSVVGAGGLMQLMPATARYFGATDVFDARQNVNAGARYLRVLLDTFHGDLDLTLAAYNAGPGAVQKYNGVPPYRETRAYVASIRTAYQRSLQ
jgi:soluble lytic murein transglycosylase-like protein